MIEDNYIKLNEHGNTTFRVVDKVRKDGNDKYLAVNKDGSVTIVDPADIVEILTAEDVEEASFKANLLYKVGLQSGEAFNSLKSDKDFNVLMKEFCFDNIRESQSGVFVIKECYGDEDVGQVMLHFNFSERRWSKSIAYKGDTVI